MGGLGRIMRRIAALLDPGRSARDRDEMLYHIEMEARELVRRGMTPREARRVATIRFGGVERHRERARQARGVLSPEDWAADLRFAVRTLRRTPAFTITAALMAVLTAVAGSAAWIPTRRASRVDPATSLREQ